MLGNNDGDDNDTAHGADDGATAAAVTSDDVVIETDVDDAASAAAHHAPLVDGDFFPDAPPADAAAVADNDDDGAAVVADAAPPPPPPPPPPPATARATAVAKRKRVTWADEASRHRGLVRRAVAFYMPQPRSSTANAAATPRARDGRGGEGDGGVAAARMAPVLPAPPLFRDKANGDGTTYKFCKAQRPSPLFAAWRHTPHARGALPFAPQPPRRRDGDKDDAATRTLFAALYPRPAPPPPSLSSSSPATSAAAAASSLALLHGSFAGGLAVAPRVRAAVLVVAGDAAPGRNTTATAATTVAPATAAPLLTLQLPFVRVDAVDNAPVPIAWPHAGAGKAPSPRMRDCTDVFARMRARHAASRVLPSSPSPSPPPAPSCVRAVHDFVALERGVRARMSALAAQQDAHLRRALLVSATAPPSSSDDVRGATRDGVGDETTALSAHAVQQLLRELARLAEAPSRDSVRSEGADDDDGGRSNEAVRIAAAARAYMLLRLRALQDEFAAQQEQYAAALLRRARRARQYARVADDAAHASVAHEERTVALLAQGYAEDEATRAADEEAQAEQLNSEVCELLAQVQELHDVLAHTNALVVAQGGLLDNVEHNVQHAVVATQRAHAQLVKAAAAQQSSSCCVV